MSSEGSRTYSNILVKWTGSSSSASLDVEITAGGSLIGSMTLTQDTQSNNLNYENNAETASGEFTAEFNAAGNGGKLYCKDFKWDLTSGKGNTTGLIGTWNVG
jgi:hypothetical protein